MPTHKTQPCTTLRLEFHIRKVSNGFGLTRRHGINHTSRSNTDRLSQPHQCLGTNYPDHVWQPPYLIYDIYLFFSAPPAARLLIPYYTLTSSFDDYYIFSE
ncbi:uncharacterized protein YALI1_E24847g [Yarrowia lipolytica]|uniref:Uncharacterized protein n=1 Tax=Yarrowia lipolytica TaxID=4952 RepID=A0A1D8NJB8_YARLL|nr:hypothetical protein YALI1_E24847g [Yarrowia lipolytica]